MDGHSDSDCLDFQVDHRLKRLAEELERMVHGREAGNRGSKRRGGDWSPLNADQSSPSSGLLLPPPEREGIQPLRALLPHSASSSATSSPAGGAGSHFPSASSEGESPRSGMQDDALQEDFQEMREVGHGGCMGFSGFLGFFGFFLGVFFAST